MVMSVTESSLSLWDNYFGYHSTQESIERELNGLVLILTQSVCTSEVSSPRSNPHKYRRRRTLEGSLVEFKSEICA